MDVGIQLDVPSELDNDSIHPEDSSLGDESANDDFSWAINPTLNDPASLVVCETLNVFVM